jgi:hypothetical protein
MPIVDAVLRLATQTIHPLHQAARVPDLDRLGTDPCFHPLAHQPRRHRVDVLLDQDRAPLAHAHLQPFLGLQPLPWQRTQQCLLLLQTSRATGIAAILDRTHQLPVLLPAGKVATATQQQFLLQRLFEAAVALLAIAILVAAGRVGCLGGHTVVTHQSLVARRVLLRGTVLVHRQGHAVGAMPLRHAAQFPQSVL